MTTSFQPPQRILMGPGPSDVHPRILSALARPTVGHLDPSFVQLMDEIKELLKKTFLTKNELTFPISAPGSAGMEACLVNLVEPGDQVLVCQNGVFGGRMADIVTRIGGQAHLLEQEWGRAIDPNQVEDYLKKHSEISIVCFVHAETSTGALSDAKTISQVAHQHNCLVIADTVTSLAGSELRVDDWQLDAVYSGSQKCLSCTPGLSPITLSERAVEKIKQRKSACVSWFLDLNLVLGYWGSGSKRSYHHTAPVNALYGLHEALVMVQEEGLENSWERHRQYHQSLIKELQKIGLKALVPEGERIPQLNAVVIPKGVDEAAVRLNALNQYGLEIGAGLGPLAGKIWRIGLMGQSCSQKNVLYCASVLKKLLS